MHKKHKKLPNMIYLESSKVGNIFGMQLFCLQLEPSCLQWSILLLTVDSLSFSTYSWSFLLTLLLSPMVILGKLGRHQESRNKSKFLDPGNKGCVSNLGLIMIMFQIPGGD